MSGALIARRYAKALASTAIQAGALLKIQEELNHVDALVRGNADLQRLVQFPLFAPSARAEAFDAILARGNASEMLRRFFRVVTQAARLDLLHEIVSEYAGLVDEKTGFVEVHVTSAQPLSAPQAEALQESLAKRAGKSVRLRWKLDHALLGGIKARLGSTVFDASLQGRLRLLQTRLLSA